MLRTMMLLSATFFLFSGHASAQFKRSNDVSDDIVGFFECAIIDSTDKKKEADPIYKIMITVSSDKTLSVMHVSAYNNLYIREKQFDAVSSVSSNSAAWEGRSLKDRAFTMRGTFEPTTVYERRYGAPRLKYTEEGFRGGRKAYAMKSVCHKTDQE